MRVVAFLGTSGMDETSLDGHGSKLDFSLFMEETEENEFSEPWFFCGYADSAGCIPARGVRAFIAQSLKNENLVGGFPVPPDQFLYSVFIQIGTRACGGAIIDRWFIISAAHCFFQADGFFLSQTPKVYLGVPDVQDGTLKKEIVLASEVFVPDIYPRYEQNVFGPADIALLKLKQPLTEKYTSVKLEPLKNSDANGISSGIFSAYGLSEPPTFDEKKRIQFNLKATAKHYFANAIIIEKSECLQYLPNLNPTQFCARIEQNKTIAGTCRGDSGSPFVNGKRLVGILSTSNIECNEQKFPGTYVDIRQFESFITTILERSYHENVHYHAYE